MHHRGRRDFERPRDVVQRLHQRKGGGGVQPGGGLVWTQRQASRGRRLRWQCGAGRAGLGGRRPTCCTRVAPAGPVRGKPRCPLARPRPTQEEQAGVGHQLDAHVHALALPAAARTAGSRGGVSRVGGALGVPPGRCTCCWRAAAPPGQGPLPTTRLMPRVSSSPMSESRTPSSCRDDGSQRRWHLGAATKAAGEGSHPHAAPPPPLLCPPYLPPPPRRLHLQHGDCALDGQQALLARGGGRQAEARGEEQRLEHGPALTKGSSEGWVVQNGRTDAWWQLAPNPLVPSTSNSQGGVHDVVLQDARGPEQGEGALREPDQQRRQHWETP